MLLRLPVTILLLGIAAAPLGAQTVVALDGYHNAEQSMPDHLGGELTGQLLEAGKRLP